VVFDLLDGERRALPQDNERFHRLVANRVGNADDARFKDVWVLFKTASTSAGAMFSPARLMSADLRSTK